MTLRNRLIAFSAVKLLALAVVFGVGFGLFHRVAVPMLVDHLHDKSRTLVRGLASELDVAVGADDRQLIAKTVAGVLDDPDLAYAEVRDAQGGVVYVQGVAPSTPAIAGAPGIAHDDGDLVRAWAPIELEGVRLGTTAICITTARVARLERWMELLLLGASVVWVVILVLSIRFARAFVAPIHAMMAFSRRVADGQLSVRLDVGAYGELASLKDDLNAMTRQLDDRERERALAAARTEALQRELVAVSRTAGMAEIATGVLHNVGNVLNSLNVSVAVVGDRLRQSKVAALGKSVQLFERHPGGLAGLLATDKGKLLPSYLASVSQQLAAENTEVRRELESVARNVDHIKTIVATQQSYARQSAVREPLDLAALVDDAIRMAELSLARHGVEVERAYAERPTVVTDRHRVLQILVNLISNASAAMKQATGVAPRLTFTLARTPVGFALTVADTGIGIEAKHLDQIFRHGFTTKRDGHGFGLHSAANTARELGGSLTAASDGPGRGARFTIELPHEAPGGGHVFHN